VVVIACALAPETRGLIDARRLALMKPGALLINIAPARMVDEEALYAALKDGHLGGAALYVWWQYPTRAEPERRPSRRPLHELPNVLMTPHSSSSSDATAERRRSAVAGNIDRFADGEPLQSVVLQTRSGIAVADETRTARTVRYGRVPVLRRCVRRRRGCAVSGHSLSW
jgi:phosphoglycerate dehydrogenase-like enzyme